MPRRFAPRLFLTISQKVKIGGVFWLMFEHFLRKTPNKEASPATARQARNTTEKYSLLFSFCARPILSSFNEKSIFLWCSAFQVFRQVAGLSTIWFRKEKAEFPPNPLPLFLSQTEREWKQAGKNSFPQPPSFLPACLAEFIPHTALLLCGAPKTFGWTGFSADRFFSLPHHPCAEKFKKLPFWLPNFNIFDTIVLSKLIYTHYK